MIDSSHVAVKPQDNFWSPPVELVQRRDAKHARRRWAAPVFAITSGKGGVGKTNVVANLATALRRSDHRVLAIDADLGMANLDLFLGVRPVATLADFFAGRAPLEELILTNHDGVLLMPGASGVQEITCLSAEQKASLLTDLDFLTYEMDIVLVDTGSGISDAVTYFTSAAQVIVVVVTPEPSSMTDAYALVKVLASQHRRQQFVVLANNAANEAEARRVFDTLSRTALRFLNVSLDYLGWIPRDAKLLWAAARAQPVVSDSPDAPSAQAFVRLADALMERAQHAIEAKGNLQFFFRRMLEAGKVRQ